MKTPITMTTTPFGLQGPFTVQIREWNRQPDRSWKEGDVVAVVTVEKCWGPMHVAAIAMRVALPRLRALRAFAEQEGLVTWAVAS